MIFQFHIPWLYPLSLPLSQLITPPLPPSYSRSSTAPFPANNRNNSTEAQRKWRANASLFTGNQWEQECRSHSGVRLRWRSENNWSTTCQLNGSNCLLWQSFKGWQTISSPWKRSIPLYSIYSYFGLCIYSTDNLHITPSQ